MRLLLVTLIISIYMPLIGQEIEPIDDFRGLKWGSQLEEATFYDEPDPVFNEIDRRGNIIVYSRPMDDHEIGAVNMREIYYFFHEGAGFFKVEMYGNDDYNEEMDAILTNRLGRKQKQRMHDSHSHWLWEIGTVIVNYREQMSKDFKLSIRSDAIDKHKSKMNEKIDDF